MDTFTRAYIEAALWVSNDETTPAGGEPLGDNYSVEDIDPQTLLKMLADCQKFQSDHWNKIANNLPLAGHDFWLTRNGHGSGFWDGDWPESGDILTTACEQYGECFLYLGDDKKIYI